MTSFPVQTEQLVEETGPGRSPVSTFIVDEAREAHIISNFDLEPFCHRLEVRVAVVGGEEDGVEIVLGVDSPWRY